MLTLGPLAFAAPWALAALAVLPAIWLLLRVTPPSPRVMSFPPLRLLRELAHREETPARTPPWLVILRMVLAALIIVGLARPVMNPRAVLPGGGPLLLVVDNGWAAGRDWPARRQALDQLIDQADREGRPVLLLPTAPNAAGDAPRAFGPVPAAEAARSVQSLEPQPWPTDRAGALAALQAVTVPSGAHVVWLTDGLSGSDGDAARKLADALQRLGHLEVLADRPERTALALRPPEADAARLTVKVERAEAGLALPVAVEAVGPDGRLLAREQGTIAADAVRTDVAIDLPGELRNEVMLLRLDGQNTAGSVVLLDERWRRRPVGLVAGRAEGEDQPLLSELFYLERALNPFSDVHRGSVRDLLARKVAVLILADVGTLPEGDAAALAEWIEKGGVLLRFAGPRLAQNIDELAPVRLRAGDRTLGGALSWSEPARLAEFPEEGPFAHLALPADVTVSRQVLAEPTADLAQKTWARLADGTPLVTGEKRGAGHLVLVHTTANPDWSNLSLSGLFVQMLRRVVALSHGVAATAGEDGAPGATLPPLQLLDGLGHLVPPPATAFPLPGDGSAVPGPRHPPGYYGSEDARQAFNLSAALPPLAPLPALPAGATLSQIGSRGELEIKPALLGLALLLAIVDLAIGLALRGLLHPGGLGWRRLGRGLAAGAVLLAAAAALPPAARAQGAGADAKAIEATSDPYLAYVVTGDAGVDATSRAGLQGLANELSRRTAVDKAGAMAVDLETDELAFYALIYWPVAGRQAALSPDAHRKVNEYLHNGGMILFDTRDQAGGQALGGGLEQLQDLLRGLDIPPLLPVPAEHVLTKSFYLIQDYPGRHAGGTVWVEASEGRVNDGVSSVVIGGNDWAGAWAVDGAGRPMNAVVPGGERQRELSYRFGINLVMYALTGNYKADQVHVPHILDRLGQ